MKEMKKIICKLDKFIYGGSSKLKHAVDNYPLKQTALAVCYLTMLP